MTTRRWIATGVVLLGCTATVSPQSPDGPLPDVVLEDAVIPEAGRDARVDDVNLLRCAPVDAARAEPPPPAETPHVVEVSTGSLVVTCARMSDGTLRCMGSNRFGELGIPGVDESRVPRVVPGITDVAQVVTWDSGGVCTRHLDGRVRCWGDNQYHLVGNGHVDDERCAGERPCRRTPTLVEGLTDVRHLAMGYSAACAVRGDGSVWCWGSSSLPERGVDATRPRRIASLQDVAWMRASFLGWLIRHRDGRYSGDGYLYPLLPPSAEATPGALNWHTCAVWPDQSVRCVGVNPSGQLGDPAAPLDFSGDRLIDPGLCGVRAVQTGRDGTCAVGVGGELWCWGAVGLLGATDLDTCRDQARCARRPRRVAGIDRVAEVFMGITETWVMRDDRSLWRWDANARGFTRFVW